MGARFRRCPAQADVILMHDRIENVPTALQLSRRARRIIRQNLIVSLGTVAILVAWHSPKNQAQSVLSVTKAAR
jgi:cation transport ATPase